MSYRHIWGFGGVKLEAGSSTCTLTNAIGTMEFEPITARYTTLNFENHIIYFGYRVKINMDAVNACDGDAADMVDLIDVLNESTYGGEDITIYPFYSTSDTSLSYNVRLVSPVAFNSVAAVKVAQRISLAFESYEPVLTLPTLASDQETGELIQLGGGSDNLLQLGGTDKILYNTGA